MWSVLAIIAFTLPSKVADEPVEPTERQGVLFDHLRVEQAWDLVGEEDVCVVGVLDTGFDFFHPALRDRLEPGYAADGVHHLSAASLTAHGTSMASLIGARRVDADGMVGLAPHARMIGASMGMPIHRLHEFRARFMEENPGAGMAELQQAMASRREELAAFGRDWLDYVSRTASEGIRDLVERGARVINFSAFVGSASFAAEPEMLARLTEAFQFAADHDVLVVIGSGNTATEVIDYPGDAETTLVVGAATLADERWVTEVDVGGRVIRQGSCFGPRLSVLAPSESLVTARPHEPGAYGLHHTPIGADLASDVGPYELVPFGATSMATAVASSLAALVRAARPDLDVATVIRVIQEGAVDLGEPGWDAQTGHGRIDFAATIERALDADPPDDR